MGEIADAMLDGTLCEQCGAYIGTPCDFPRLCAGCGKEAQAAGESVRKTGLGGYQRTRGKPLPALKEKCSICGKTLRFGGSADHKRAVHGL